MKGYIPKEVVYFLGRPHSTDVKIQVEEVSDFAFLPYEAARKRLTFETNRKLLDKAQAFVESLNEMKWVVSQNYKSYTWDNHIAER